jgi:hypothetical protein
VWECRKVLPVHQEEVTLSEQDTTLTDDQIRGESTFGETETPTPDTEEGDTDGMDTGGAGADSDDSDSDSDGTDS